MYLRIKVKGGTYVQAITGPEATIGPGGQQPEALASLADSGPGGKFYMD